MDASYYQKQLDDFEASSKKTNERLERLADQTRDHIAQVRLLREQVGHDFSQKLTFFIVGAELAICGYTLVYKEALKSFYLIPEIFLISGISALFGLLWRSSYNRKLRINLSILGNEGLNFFDEEKNLLYRVHVMSSLFLALLIVIAGYVGFRFKGCVTLTSNQEVSDKLLQRTPAIVEQYSEDLDLLDEEKVKVSDSKGSLGAPIFSPALSPAANQHSLSPELNPSKNQQSPRSH